MHLRADDQVAEVARAEARAIVTENFAVSAASSYPGLPRHNAGACALTVVPMVTRPCT